MPLSKKELDRLKKEHDKRVEEERDHLKVAEDLQKKKLLDLKTEIDEAKKKLPKNPKESEIEEVTQNLREMVKKMISFSSKGVVKNNKPLFERMINDIVQFAVQNKLNDIITEEHLNLVQTQSSTLENFDTTALLMRAIKQLKNDSDIKINIEDRDIKVNVEHQHLNGPTPMPALRSPFQKLKPKNVVLGTNISGQDFLVHYTDKGGQLLTTQQAEDHKLKAEGAQAKVPGSGWYADDDGNRHFVKSSASYPADDIAEVIGSNIMRRVMEDPERHFKRTNEQGEVDNFHLPQSFIDKYTAMETQGSFIELTEEGTNKTIRIPETALSSNELDEPPSFNKTIVPYSFVWNQDLNKPFVSCPADRNFVQSLKESILDYEVFMYNSREALLDVPPTHKNAIILIENAADKKKRDVYIVKNGKWLITDKGTPQPSTQWQGNLPQSKMTPELLLSLSNQRSSIGAMPLSALANKNIDPKNYSFILWDSKDKLPSNPPIKNNGFVLVEKWIDNKKKYDVYEISNGEWNPAIGPFGHQTRLDEVELPINLPLEPSGKEQDERLQTIIKTITQQAGVPRTEMPWGADPLTQENKNIINMQLDTPLKKRDMARILAAATLVDDRDRQYANIFIYRDENNQERLGSFDFGWSMADLCKNPKINIFGRLSAISTDLGTHNIKGGKPTNHLKDYLEIIKSQYFVDELRAIANNYKVQSKGGSMVRENLDRIKLAYQHIQDPSLREENIKAAYIKFGNHVKVNANLKNESSDGMKNIIMNEVNTVLHSRAASMLVSASLLEMRLLRKDLQQPAGISKERQAKFIENSLDNFLKTVHDNYFDPEHPTIRSISDIQAKTYLMKQIPKIIDLARKNNLLDEINPKMIELCTRLTSKVPNASVQAKEFQAVFDSKVRYTMNPLYGQQTKQQGKAQTNRQNEPPRPRDHPDSKYGDEWRRSRGIAASNAANFNSASTSSLSQSQGADAQSQSQSQSQMQSQIQATVGARTRFRSSTSSQTLPTEPNPAPPIRDPATSPTLSPISPLPSPGPSTPLPSASSSSQASVPPQPRPILTAHSQRIRNASATKPLVVNATLDNQEKSFENRISDFINDAKNLNPNAFSSLTTKIHQKGAEIFISNDARLTIAPPSTTDISVNIKEIINPVRNRSLQEKTRIQRENIELIALSLMRMGDPNPVIFQGSPEKAVALYVKMAELAKNAHGLNAENDRSLTNNPIIKPTIKNIPGFEDYLTNNPNSKKQFEDAEKMFAEVIDPSLKVAIKPKPQ